MASQCPWLQAQFKSENFVIQYLASIWFAQGTIVLALSCIRCEINFDCGTFLIASVVIEITMADFVIADVTDSMLDGVIAGSSSMAECF